MEDIGDKIEILAPDFPCILFDCSDAAESLNKFRNLNSAICFLQECCLSFHNVNSFTTPYCYGVTCVPNVGNDKNSWSWKKFPIGIWKKLMNYFVLSKQFTSSPLYNFQEIALKLDPLQGY